MNQPPDTSKHLIIIGGPTATGKTALAIQLARHFHTEIISADSRQIYRQLRIGTARPSPEELSSAKHHLVGHVDITEDYSAARFEQEALALLEEIFQTRDVAVMAGGTGLYIKAVCEGLDAMPEVDPSVRRQLQQLYHSHGIGALQHLLEKKDPEYYRQVDIHNPQRLIRALEVCLSTGKPFSSFRKGKVKPRPFKTIKIALHLPKESLQKNIEARVRAMIDNGLVEEVESLLPYKHLNALQTVGYKEIIEYLEGKHSLEKAIELIIIHTRQYAKRQMTWFKKDKAFQWFHPGQFQEILNYLYQIMGF